MSVAAALLDRDVHGGGARVERVLDQLLHHGGRALDHFPRRDLVGDGVRQNGDAGHGESYRTRAAEINRW